MSAAIFAIVSPLQYINALEAVYAFNLKPEQCYLALGISRKLPASGIQVQKLLRPELWRAVRTLKGLPAERGFTRIHSEILGILGARQYANNANELIQLAEEECGSVSHLFIGDYRPANFRHFLARVPHAECWLLDDGSVTHQVVRHRKDPTSPHIFARQFARETLGSRARGAVSGLRFVEPPSVGFFTCYDIDAAPRDRVRCHDYPYFRQALGQLTRSEEIWFLGANHSENGFTTEERYLQLLSAVRRFYGDKAVIYLPHRGETQEKLRKVVELGFNVEHFDLPVEIVVGQGGRFPKVLAGVASSAIDNLSVILGKELRVHIFRVGDEYSSGGRWKHLKDVVAYHERDVCGIATFVHERDDCVFERDEFDIRLTPLSDMGSGGYYRDLQGWLRGYDVASIVRRGTSQGVVISLSQPSENRVYRRDDRVDLLEPKSGRCIAASVLSATPRGELELAFEDASEGMTEDALLICRRASRLEYDEDSRILGALMEPCTENFLRHSEFLNEDSWKLEGVHPFEFGSLSRATLCRAPNGRHEASFLKSTASFGFHRLLHSVELERAGVYTLSLYYRSGGVDCLLFDFKSELSEFRNSVRFRDLESEVIAGVTHSTIRASAVSAGHGWVRYSATVVLPAERTEISFCFSNGGQEEFLGDGCSGGYFWGAQLERGVAATSYVPTFSSSRRREAERVVHKWGRSEDALYVEFTCRETRGLISVVDLGDGQRVQLDGPANELVVCGRRWEERVGLMSARFEDSMVLALVRRGGALEVGVKGGGVVACPHLVVGEDICVTGGPFHLKRVHSGAIADWLKKAVADGAARELPGQNTGLP